MLESPQEFVIIPLVETDARFIENIDYANQAGTNLGCQTDALGFAAGKGSGRPGQGQIIQTDINQKSQSCPDFPDYLLTNQLLLGSQGQVFHEIIEIQDRIIGDLTDIFSTYGHGKGFFFQSLSAALITRSNGHKGLILLPAHLRSGLPVAALHILDQTFKGNIVYPNAPLTLVVHLHLTAALPVDDQVFDFLRVLLKWRIQTEMILTCQCFQHLVRKAALIRSRLPAHNRNGPLIEAERIIRNQEIRSKLHLISQAVADRAGTKWIVKRKTAGLNLLKADSAVRAGKALTEGQIPAFIRYVSDGQPLCKTQGCLQRICQSLFNAGADGNPVHHDCNGVFLIFLQFDLLGELILVTVYHHADIAALAGLFKDFDMLTLAAAHYRCQQLDPCALGKCQDDIHHLVYSLAADFSAALRAVGDADSGVKQSEIIVDFRHGSHCGPWVAVG